MKKTLTFLIFIFSMLAMGADEEKIYTQKELDEKIKAEVERQVNMIKKKSITQLTTEILEKERKLNAKELEVEQRAEQLKISEKSLLQRIAAFDKQKAKIIGCIEDNERNELMRVKQLVEVISNMKPQKAAELLSVQESEISVKLIEKIDPAKASKIFNLMDKEVSARLQKQYLNMQQ